MNASRESYCHNDLVQPLLTDFYQITMAYAYWQAKKTNEKAVFDLYFRKNPFDGEFTIFAGLSECLLLMQSFRFKETDIVYLRETMPATIDEEFFKFLLQLTTNDVKLYAIAEGSVCFPRVPLLRIEGPLIICQLLETTLLNLINYASLVATNAARIRLAAGPNALLLEFGLRRAQGPDGGLSASRYSYLGGFDGTSNVLAGKMFGIPVKGTHAHAFVASFCSRADVVTPLIGMTLKNDKGKDVNFLELCDTWLRKLENVLPFLIDQVQMGEFAAFVSYGISFPRSFLCLIDTYDVLKSGMPNFCAVALALHECGYKPIGIRLDSGDLAYLSIKVRENFEIVAEKYNLPWFSKLTIVASNDINEDTIHSLKQQGHEIDSFGIGTHLVTCQKQPALGGVYKLVELNGRSTMKLSEDIKKMTIPGKKDAYRLFSKDNIPLVDFMQRTDEVPPKPNERVLCRHPYQPSKRAYVTPAKVEPLYKLYWANGKVCATVPDLKEKRKYCMKSVENIRSDHKRALNPTPYKVSVSDNLYNFTQEMWLQCAPIGELS